MLISSTPPGAYLAVLGQDHVALEGRAVGLELRDALLILDGNGSRVAFLFRRPAPITLAEQVLVTQGKGLDIEACRLSKGRWPTNLLLIHDGCSLGCSPTCPVRKLDGQTGMLQSGTPSGTRKSAKGYGGNIAVGSALTGYGDAGGGSRFFPQFQDGKELVTWLEKLVLAQPGQENTEANL